MNQKIPARLSWATSIVAKNSPSSILEVGYGRGVAIAELANLLAGARIVGVDRSSVAYQAASTRNAELTRTGRCSLQQSDLLGATLTGPFEAILAVNVNVFWATRASEQLATVQALLAADGLFYLFYETPSEAQSTRINSDLKKHLAAAGLELVKVFQERLGPNAGIGIIASLPRAHT